MTPAQELLAYLLDELPSLCRDFPRAVTPAKYAALCSAVNDWSAQFSPDSPDWQQLAHFLAKLAITGFDTKKIYA